MRSLSGAPFANKTANRGLRGKICHKRLFQNVFSANRIRIRSSSTSILSMMAPRWAFRKGIAPVVSFSRMTPPKVSMRFESITGPGRLDFVARSRAATAAARSSFKAEILAFRMSSKSDAPSSTSLYRRRRRSSVSDRSLSNSRTRSSADNDLASRRAANAERISERRSGPNNR